MRFANQAYLWILLGLPLIICLSLYSERYLHKIRHTFAVHNHALGQWRSWGRIILPVLIFICINFAISNFQLKKMQAGVSLSSIGIIIGLDISKSMLAEDVTLEAGQAETYSLSNRLNLGRRFALDLIDKMNGQKVGLFLFAQKGVELVPPTRDYGLLRYILYYTSLTELSLPGSSLSAALDTAKDMCTQLQDSALKIVVLITDGEDTENKPADIMKSIQPLASSNIRMYCLGVGTKEQDFIPVRYGNVIEGFYRDEQGKFLQTRLQEDLLIEISKLTQGRYWSIEGLDNGQAFQALLKEVNKDITELKEIEAEKYKKMTWVDLTPIFLLSTLFLYTIYFFI